MMKVLCDDDCEVQGVRLDFDHQDGEVEKRVVGTGIDRIIATAKQEPNKENNGLTGE